MECCHCGNENGVHRTVKCAGGEHIGCYETSVDEEYPLCDDCLDNISCCELCDMNCSDDVYMINTTFGLVCSDCADKIICQNSTCAKFDASFNHNCKKCYDEDEFIYGCQKAKQAIESNEEGGR